MKPALMRAPEEAVQIGRFASQVRQQLAPIRSLIMRLLGEVDKEQASARGAFVSWDWDMIRNYMYQESPSQVFSGALIRALNEDNKIVILEGARREMRDFLIRRAQQFRLARIFSESRTPESRAAFQREAYTRSSEWQSIIQNIDLLTEDRGIRRLDEFLNKHAQTLFEVGGRSGIGSHNRVRKSPEYARAFQMLRFRQGMRRNQADAINVAQVRMAATHGFMGRLVTGTNDLLENFNDVAVDPFTSLVSSQLRRSIPSAKARSMTLNRWLSQVTKLIDHVNLVEESLKGTTAPITRRRTRDLEAAISILRDEPLLSQCTELLERSLVLARTRGEASSRARVPVEIETAGKAPHLNLRYLEAALNKLVEERMMEGAATIESLGFSWTRTAARDEYNAWSLLNERDGKRLILRLEQLGARYSLSWDVVLSIDDLVEKVNRVIQAFGSQRPPWLFFQALLADSRIVGREIDLGKQRRVTRPKRLSLSEPIRRVRLVTERTAIYYEPTPPDLARNPSLSIVDDDPSFRWFLPMYSESALDYVPAKLLQDSVSRCLQTTSLKK